MNFDYDEQRDSLMLSAKKTSDKVQGSAKVGNLVLDFTSDGKVVNVEIERVTDFFKSAGVNHEPNEIASATLNVQYKQNCLVIIAELKFQDKEEQTLPMFVYSESSQLAEI